MTHDLFLTFLWWADVCDIVGFAPCTTRRHCPRKLSNYTPMAAQVEEIGKDGVASAPNIRRTSTDLSYVMKLWREASIHSLTSYYSGDEARTDGKKITSRQLDADCIPWVLRANTFCGTIWSYNNQKKESWTIPILLEGKVIPFKCQHTFLGVTIDRTLTRCPLRKQEKEKLFTVAAWYDWLAERNECYWF